MRDLQTGVRVVDTAAREQRVVSDNGRLFITHVQSQPPPARYLTSVHIHGKICDFIVSEIKRVTIFTSYKVRVVNHREDESVMVGLTISNDENVGQGCGDKFPQKRSVVHGSNMGSV
jgi:hypothetical protein